MHASFDADMARTGRELLSKRQFAQPQAYPDGLLRTGQRRLKIWRDAMASELGFGANHDATNLMPLDAVRDVEASRAGGHQDPTVALPSPSQNHQEHLTEAAA